MLKGAIGCVAGAVISFVCLSTAEAQTQPTVVPYNASYVFGDSLSDRGNLAELLGKNLPNPPFYHDSFTNGDVAVEVMARDLGLTANPSLFVTGFTDRNNLGLTVGTNYAVAGSTAGTLAGVPGANLPNQVGAYLAHSGQLADPNALYTVFIGGNDVRTAAHQGSDAYVTSGETAEAGTLAQLIGAGAKNILVVNVPDVGAIPEFRLLYPSQDALATSETVRYNNLLGQDIVSLSNANPTISLKEFDLFNYALNLSALGITDTSDPCYTNTGVSTPSSATSAACGPIDPATGQAMNIGQLQYWDYIHPTAKVQNAIGNALASFVLSPTAAVPEPDSWAMMIFGMGAIGFAMRRRQKVTTRPIYAV